MVGIGLVIYKLSESAPLSTLVPIIISIITLIYTVKKDPFPTFIKAGWRIIFSKIIRNPSRPGYSVGDFNSRIENEFEESEAEEPLIAMVPVSKERSSHDTIRASDFKKHWNLI